jgi:DNA repair protein RadC
MLPATTLQFPQISQFTPSPQSPQSPQIPQSNPLNNEYKIIQTLVPVINKPTINNQEKITNPFQAAEKCSYIADIDQEVVAVITLNTQCVVLSDFVVSIGLVDKALCSPREIFRKAIIENAIAIIVVHNHPSGCLDVSPEDIRITKQLIEAGKIIGIKVMDSIIVCPSFSEKSENNFDFVSILEKNLVDGF